MSRSPFAISLRTSNPTTTRCVFRKRFLKEIDALFVQVLWPVVSATRHSNHWIKAGRGVPIQAVEFSICAAFAFACKI